MVGYLAPLQPAVIPSYMANLYLRRYRRLEIQLKALLHSNRNFSTPFIVLQAPPGLAVYGLVPALSHETKNQAQADFHIPVSYVAVPYIIPRDKYVFPCSPQ